MKTYRTVSGGLVQEWRLDEAETAILAAAEAGDHGQLLRLVQLVKGKASSEGRRATEQRQDDRRLHVEQMAARFAAWEAQCDRQDDEALTQLDQATADWRAAQARAKYEAEQRPTFADPFGQLRL